MNLLRAPGRGARSTSSSLILLPGFARTSVLSFSGFGVTAYVAGTPASRPGLELMWLVPLSFAVCVVVFTHIVDYHRGGVGLKVLYAIVVIRYLVSPALIVATRGRVSPAMVAASASGYRFSTLVTVAELVVCCTTISVAWPRVSRRLAERPPRRATVRQQGSALTIGGVVIVALLAAVVRVRGFNGVTSSFGFLMLTTRYRDGPVDSFSVTAVQVAKSFLFVGLAVGCARAYVAKRNPLWFLLAAGLAFVNITTYFGYNRSIIVETGIATIVTLVYLFPPFRRLVVAVLAPVGMAVVYSLVTLKQFGVSATSGQIGSRVSIDDLSRTIETYVNGAWPLATSYDAASAMSGRVGASTLIRSYTDNFFLFKVPHFTLPNDLLSGVPSVVDLYQSFTWPAQGAMLPLSGEMWFYGGAALGPFFVVAGNALVFYLLVQIELRSKLAAGAQNKFIYSWLGALFGLAMCYCLITIWWSFSKFAFFLAILFWLNNRVVLRRVIDVGRP